MWEVGRCGCGCVCVCVCVCVLVCLLACLPVCHVWVCLPAWLHEGLLTWFHILSVFLFVLLVWLCARHMKWLHNVLSRYIVRWEAAAVS